MTFTLLPTIGPWFVALVVVTGLGLLLAAVALVDAVRSQHRAVAAPVVAPSRPARRATSRLHHA